MDKRKDALGGVSKLHLDIRQISKALKGSGTVGRRDAARYRHGGGRSS